MVGIWGGGGSCPGMVGSRVGVGVWVQGVVEQRGWWESRGGRGLANGGVKWWWGSMRWWGLGVVRV